MPRFANQSKGPEKTEECLQTIDLEWLVKLRYCGIAVHVEHQRGAVRPGVCYVLPHSSILCPTNPPPFCEGWRCSNNSKILCKMVGDYYTCDLFGGN